MNGKDIRRAILEVMNKQRKSARHEHEIRMHVQQIDHALHDEGYDLEDEEIMEAVNYLAESKMIKQSKEIKTIKPVASRYGSARSGASSKGFKHTNYYYTLTVRAIDELDGETEYSKKPFVPFQNISINTTNAPVIVGSNNNVSSHIVIFNQLDELQQRLTESDDLSIEERQDVASDIESIKQQLAKPNPNPAVVKMLWKNVGRAADIAGVASLAIEVAKGIAAITGNPIG